MAKVCIIDYNISLLMVFRGFHTLSQLKFFNFCLYLLDDIMLGLFLERYCFRSSYICRSCKLPMMNHVRKYAHSMGVITVRLAEDPIKNESSSIVMTSRCTLCNTMTPRVGIAKNAIDDIYIIFFIILENHIQRRVVFFTCEIS